MGGEEHDGCLAVPLYFPYLLEHLHVDGDLLEQTLEGFVEGVGHAPHHGDFHLGYQFIDQLLGLHRDCLPGLFSGEVELLHLLLDLVVDGLEDPAGGEDLGLDLVDGPEGHLGLYGPLEVAEILLVGVDCQKVLVCLDGVLGMLLEDVLLDAVVVDLDELPGVKFGDVDLEDFLLLRAEPICQLFAVLALVDPLIVGKKLEELAYLFGPVVGFVHFICGFLVLLAHEGGDPFVDLERQFVL